MSGACRRPPPSAAANTAIAFGAPVGAQIRPFERIDGDVDLLVACPWLSVGANSHAFTDVEHRRFIAFPFTDDYGSIHWNRLHHGSHRFNGDKVGLLAISLSHHSRSGDRGSLNDTKKIKEQIVLHRALIAHGDGLLETSILRIVSVSSDEWCLVVRRQTRETLSSSWSLD
jgi:hypothetical protein